LFYAGKPNKSRQGIGRDSPLFSIIVIDDFSQHETIRRMSRWKRCVRFPVGARPADRMLQPGDNRVFNEVRLAEIKRKSPEFLILRERHGKHACPGKALHQRASQVLPGPSDRGVWRKLMTESLVKSISDSSSQASDDERLDIFRRNQPDREIVCKGLE